MNSIEHLGNEIYASGIKTIFGIPGSGPTLSLIDNLETRGVQFCLTQFEGSAALMAATVGRLSNKAGISLSIKGPGLTNSIPGIAAAWFESFPLVHLTEATPFDAPARVAHKRVDQNALCKAIVKGSNFLNSGSGVFTKQAEFATSEEPGPVLLQLSEGRPSEDHIEENLRIVSCLLNEETRNKIKKARKPVIIAGTLAIRKQWSSQLSKLSFPVFSTVSAKGVIDENLPQAAGVYTGVGLELTPESTLFIDCDLVIGFGLTGKEVLAVKPFNVTSINIESVDTVGTEGFNFENRLGISEFSEVIDLLLDKTWGIDTLSQKQHTLFHKLTNDFLPGIVYRTIEEHFLSNVRVVLDTGYFCTIGEHTWRARRPELCLLSGNGRYMGTCLPMAIGASIYDSTVTTVAVVGDGGIGMYLAEIKLAVKLKLPLLLILMTDNSFGSIRTRSIKDGLTQKPLLMDTKSWIPVLNGFDVPGERVESVAQLQNALKFWNKDNGPAFIEIPFDPDNYQQMVQGIR